MPTDDRKCCIPHDLTRLTATMIITSITAAHTSPVVLAGNKTAHVVLQFTVIAHKILGAVAPVAVHVVDADAPILARPR
jgi:hypothetical protein